MSTELNPAPISAEAALQAAYEEWCRVSNAEAEAIHDRRWDLVCEFETSLRRLQEYILEAIQSAQVEWIQQGVARETREATVRLIFSELIDRQTRNQGLLEQHHREAVARVEAENTPLAGSPSPRTAPPSCRRDYSRRFRL